MAYRKWMLDLQLTQHHVERRIFVRHELTVRYLRANAVLFELIKNSQVFAYSPLSQAYDKTGVPTANMSVGYLALWWDKGVAEPGIYSVFELAYDTADGFVQGALITYYDGRRPDSGVKFKAGLVDAIKYVEKRAKPQFILV